MFRALILIATAGLLPSSCGNGGDGGLSGGWKGSLALVYDNGTTFEIDIPGMILTDSSATVELSFRGCDLSASRSGGTLSLAPDTCVVPKDQPFTLNHMATTNSDPLSIRIVSADPTMISDTVLSFHGKAVLTVQSASPSSGNVTFTLDLSR